MLFKYVCSNVLTSVRRIWFFFMNCFLYLFHVRISKCKCMFFIWSWKHICIVLRIALSYNGWKNQTHRERTGKLQFRIWENRNKNCNFVQKREAAGRRSDAKFCWTLDVLSLKSQLKIKWTQIVISRQTSFQRIRVEITK